MTALVIADKENVFSADDSGVIKVANLALYKQEYFVFSFLFSDVTSLLLAILCL